MPQLIGVMPEFGTGYPYRYAPHDTSIRRALRSNLRPVDPRVAVDVATLTIVLAVHGVYGEEFTPPVAPIAYSLLREVRDQGNTCDVQTSIAYLVAIDTEADLEHVRREVRLAEQMCPNDPTPMWLWARVLSTQAAVTGEFRDLAETSAERRRLAEAAFADLRTRFPDIPVGYAGAADLYLYWADSAEGEGGEPFQVRAWRRQAVELYGQARQRFDDPRLAAGHARALSDVGQSQAAVDLINQVVTQDPSDPAIAALRSSILSQAGRHAEAAAAIAAEATRQPWWQGRESFFGADYLSGYYGWTEYPPLDIPVRSIYEYGAGGVDDISFIPLSRFGRVGSACRTLVAMEEWLLAGQPDRVHQLATEPSDGSSPEDCRDGIPDMTALAHLATGSWSDFEAVIARISNPDGDSTDQASVLLDSWQDLLRSAGQFDAARLAALAWTQREPRSPHAFQRLAETNYFLENYDEAADLFARSATLYARQARKDPETSDHFAVYPAENRIWARLEQAAALQRLGRDDRAEQVLFEAAEGAAKITIEGSDWTDYVELHAHSQLGNLAIRRKDWSAAADHLQRAIMIGQPHDEILNGRLDSFPTEELGQNGMLHGAQENNLALAYVKLGKSDKAIPIAEKALVRDPASPIFLDTVAFALHAEGRTSEAVSYYREALRQDPTSYASANNLAVLLAGSGHPAAAREVLEMAVRADPTYALGWHNLGVLERDESVDLRHTCVPKERLAGPRCWSRGYAAPTRRCGPIGSSTTRGSTSPGRSRRSGRTPRRRARRAPTGRSR